MHSRLGSKSETPSQKKKKKERKKKKHWHCPDFVISLDSEFSHVALTRGVYVYAELGRDRISVKVSIAQAD